MAIEISANITTKNAADTYATHLANLGKGGAHSKDSIAQMNSITTDRRFRFMLCVVANTGSGSPGLYWLNTPPNPTRTQLADNNNWQPVPLGIQSEGVLTLLGFQNASSLTILDSTGSNGDTYIVDVGGSVNNPDIFGGQAVTLVVGDYLVYNNNQWNVVPTGASSVNWNTLAGKPSTFTPSPHTHVISDITDFPDLSSFLTDQDVVNTITNQTNSVLLGNVGAIRDYVTAQINDITFPEVDLSNYYTKSETEALIDAIQGYTLYTSPSLTQLNIDVPNPNNGEFAYIQGEYSMYRREAGQWVFQYNTANPSSDEAKFLNTNVASTATLKAVGTVALSENNYILYRDSSDTFLKVYKLVFGTATESLPDTVLPNDYDEINNAKYWQLVGSGGAGGIAPEDIINDFSTDPNNATKVAGANAVYTLFQILASNDVNYDTIQEIVDFIKTIDTDGELIAAIDTAVGNTDWRQDSTPTVDATYTNLGATPSFDLDTADVFKRTVNENVTNLSFTGGIEGKVYQINIQIDATGGYAFNYTNTDIITLGEGNTKLKLITEPNFINIINVKKIGTQYLVYPDIDKLLQLNDFLSTYQGQASNVLGIKSTEDGVEGVPTVNLDLTTVGINSFLELEDTPNSYVGLAGTIPVVKATEDGIENRNTVEINFDDGGAGSVTPDTILEITFGGSTYRINAEKL